MDNPSPGSARTASDDSASTRLGPVSTSTTSEARKRPSNAPTRSHRKWQRSTPWPAKSSASSSSSTNEAAPTSSTSPAAPASPQNCRPESPSPRCGADGPPTRHTPRVRGGHSSHAGRTAVAEGPPPPTRGPHHLQHPQPVVRGTTPARAGTTATGSCSPGTAGDHPRTRGDHAAVAEAAGVLLGPPPPTQGPQLTAAQVRAVGGTTPAYAGTTDPHPAAWSLLGDHPRLRGDHVAAGVDRLCREGPPPPTRGPQTATCCFMTAYPGFYSLPQSPTYAANTPLPPHQPESPTAFTTPRRPSRPRAEAPGHQAPGTKPPPHPDRPPHSRNPPITKSLHR